LTTEQIVVLIILLVSFVIILYFLFRLNLGKQSDSQICHNSIVMRGSSVVPTDAVPLKCSRSYVCITKDGSCEGMTKPEVEKVKTEEEIYNILAEKMADCWWMFGEGKVNYVTNTMQKNNYCSICSQVLFDDSLNEIENEKGENIFSSGQISKDSFYEYLSETKVPDTETTYLQYFRINNLEGLKQEVSSQAGKEVNLGTIKIGEQYFVVMGITSQVKTIDWVLGGTVVGGLAVIGAAAAGIIGTAGLIAIVAGDFAGGVGGGGLAKISDLLSPRIGAIVVEGEGVKNTFMVPTIQEANSEEFELLNCEEVLTTT
jgi:hypothetical protein